MVGSQVVEPGACLGGPLRRHSEASSTLGPGPEARNQKAQGDDAIAGRVAGASGKEVAVGGGALVTVSEMQLAEVAMPRASVESRSLAGSDRRRTSR